MGRIRQMSESLATLVAAGEVVQGPHSVVKELVDNALDAGARLVDVEIVQGGLRSIRVADDGAGMDRTDAELCLSRHATSKLFSEEDLSRIVTMGFRGEALPSIAAVSRTQITTQQADGDTGTTVIAAAGQVQEIRPDARRPGTTVEVQNLFFNTPARLADCNSPSAEASAVYRTLVDLAMARPEVRFRLVSDGRELLNCPPAPTLLERIQQIHGTEFARTLLPFQAERGSVRVHGFVTRPDVGRKRTSRTTYLVNGRPFKSYVLKRVIAQEFQGRLPHGYHPEAILCIEVPPQEVNVNVSPDKSEVKFSQAKRVWATVTDGLRYALGDRAAIAPVESPHSSAPSIALAEEQAPRFSLDPLPRALPQSSPRSVGTSRPRTGEESNEHRAFSTPERTHNDIPAEVARDPHTEQRGTTPRHGIPEHPPVLIQIANTFIACPVEDGLLVVDQHSAHERILYERFRAQYERNGRNTDSQPLLFPITLDADTQELLLLEEMTPLLEKMGFEVAPAGPREFFISAVPAALGNASPLTVIRSLMETYRKESDLGAKASEIGEGITEREDRMLMTMACKAAIKSGQVLSEEKMRALWNELVRVDLATHDVHGRPGALIWGAHEIARKLGRSSISGLER